MATTLKEAWSISFPQADVEACIRDALADQAAQQAILRPGRSPATRPMSRPTWEPEIDSLVVIEVIISVEELLGIELLATICPIGGYDSVEDCVNDIVPEAKRAWAEARKGNSNGQ
jgi:hypothetical protein